MAGSFRAVRAVAGGHERFARWEADGTWGRLLKDVQGPNDSVGAVEWTVSDDPRSTGPTSTPPAPAKGGAGWGRCRTCLAACRRPAAWVRCWTAVCRRPSCRPGSARDRGVLLLPASRPRKTPMLPVSITVPPLTRCRWWPGFGVVLAHPRYADLPPADGRALRPAGRWSDLSSASPTAPLGPGDTTPQVIRSTGGHSHAGPGGREPVAGPQKGNEGRPDLSLGGRGATAPCGRSRRRRPGGRPGRAGRW